MKKKQSSQSSLAHEVISSEPFNTFYNNADAISRLLKMSSRSISEKERELTQDLDRTRKDQKHEEGQLQNYKDQLKEYCRMNRQIKGKQKPRELEELIENFRRLIATTKRLIRVQQSLVGETYRPLLDMYQKQKAVLMPMVFVYLVTIWDAFVLDTVRKILGVHPQLMTANREAKIEVSTAFLWDAHSIEDVRNRIVEETVQDLDYDRKKLVKCFADYWGIDWEESGVSLDELVEIRARRDIWIHNKGIVNKQYLDMVGGRTSLKEGQVTEIDAAYIDACQQKLMRLAAYIHSTAYAKHYSRTAAG